MAENYLALEERRVFGALLSAMTRAVSCGNARVKIKVRAGGKEYQATITMLWLQDVRSQVSQSKKTPGLLPSLLVPFRGKNGREKFRGKVPLRDIKVVET